jgi:trans-aconitate 2-methyltransferase
MWDPIQYLRFADERARPFVELVARVGADAPRLVVDVGCGPGNLTALLAQRWPDAEVVGIDSSPEMIERARADAPSVRFEVASATEWEPDGPVDVVVSNATLHWVPDHETLVERMVGWLPPDGWLAFQVPGNFAAPSHVSIVEVRTSPRWAPLLGAGAGEEASSRSSLAYATLLLGLGCDVDAWETTYLHVLQGDDPVLHWVMGTALRPALARLSDDGERDAFLAEVAARLRAAYPPGGHGTLFPFRRVFAVAHRMA